VKNLRKSHTWPRGSAVAAGFVRWLSRARIARGGIRTEVPWVYALAGILGVVFQFALSAEGHNRAINDYKISGGLAHEICSLCVG
jgi:hypothetical protein